MEEEDIDLRPYIRALGRRLWWIVGLGLLAAIAGFVISSLRPTVFQASSSVLVSQQDPAYKAFSTFAVSDKVLQAVVDTYKPPADAQINDWSPAALATKVKASTGSDPSVLKLQVQTGSPQASAGIAHQWADVLVDQGNKSYNNPAQDLKLLEDQTAQAEQALSAANTALIEFQSRNQASILDVRLEAQQQAQKDFLATQLAISNTSREAKGLRDQLAQQPSTQPVSAADSLAVLMLEVKAYSAGTEAPVQIGNSNALSNMSRQEHIALLDNLVTTLQARATQSEAQLKALEPQILASQRQVQEAQTEFDNVTRRQKQAEQTYMTLARKLDDTRLAAEKPNRTFQLQGYASVPQSPIDPRPIRNSAMAAVLGLMLGVFAVIAVEWWRQ